jgi:hypothetical protein
LSFRTLAAAPGYGTGGSDLSFYRREGGAFVRAVAKRLRLGPSTRAPKIGAGFDFLDVRLFLGSSWFAHAYLLARGGGGGNDFNDLF